MNRQLLYAILLSGISLGTAWAIRGQFGHEQGAAWAGAIGGLAIVLISKRKDWYDRAFQLALASAAGWGVTGIISYGQVVGYGRSSDFGNAFYGLLMLFVIGGLFGLMGGGMFGLTLSDTKENPVKWSRLLTEMAAGALIFYYFLIEELGWLMTPPRLEAWAAALGMFVALLWYMIRHKHTQAIRLAVITGLGAGFGFAFGNFLQVLGSTSGLKFNFWNVMEYSIGFFGGVGMAYGTFTSTWPETRELVGKQRIIIPLIIVVMIIPFLVWDQSFDSNRISEYVQNISPTADLLAITRNVQWVSFTLMLAISALSIYYFYIKNSSSAAAISENDLFISFLTLLGLYIIYSFLITGAFMSLYRPEQYLYILNFIAIFFLIRKSRPNFTDRGLNINRWTINLLFVLVVIALCTAIAVSSHGPLNGAHDRF